MSKPITAKNPIKKLVVARFKAQFQCTKVTCVTETETHYRANCLRRHPKFGGHFESLGFKELPKQP